MEGEPDAKIQNDSHDGRRDAGKGGAQRAVAAQKLDVRGTQKDPEEAWDERDPGRHDRAQDSGHHRIEPVKQTVGSHEADELEHHDERPRGGLGHAQAVQHLAWPKPPIGLHRLLADVGEHRVGAAEGDHRRLAEEDPLLHQDVLPAEDGRQHEQRDKPKRQADREDADRAPQGGPDAVRLGIHHRHVQGLLGVGGRGRLGCGELLGQPAPAEPADEPRGGDDHRKRDVQKEDPDEGRASHRQEEVGFERPPADAEDGLDDDRQHRWLQPEEQRGDERRVLVSGIEYREGQDGKKPGDHEQDARGEAAGGPVKEPADVDGELLGFGTGQQHAVVEGVEEAALAHPPPFIHEDAVHDRDLARRSAEALEGDQRPDP